MVANGFSSLTRSVAASAVLCGMLAGCASTEQHGTQASLSPAQTNVPQPQTATGVAAATAPSASANTTTVASADPSQSQLSTTGHAALAKTGRIQPGQLQAEAQEVAQVPAGETPASEAKPLPGAPAMLMDRMGQPIVAQKANQGQAAIAAVTGAGRADPSAAAAYAATGEPVVPTVVAIPMANPSRPGEAAAMRPVATASAEQSPIPMTEEMVAIQLVVPTPRPGEDSLMRPTEVAFAASVPQLAYASSQPHYDFNFDTSGPTVVPAVMTFKADDSAVSPAETAYISKLIAKYAKIYQVPSDLIHRVVHRESRYNPKAYNNSGYFGLMQIKYNTAKSMGYDGPPSGLFDAETNIKYAAKYLRGAWMVSDKTPADAVGLYARGYYYDAKRKGMDDIAKGNY